MFSFWKFKTQSGLVSVLVLLSILLAACGNDTPSPASVAGTTVAGTATTAGTSSATIAAGMAVTGTTAASGGTTTVASGGTAAAGATTAAASSLIPANTEPVGPCRDADAAPAANAPKPTPADTTAATLPELRYTSANVLSPKDTTTQGVLKNLSTNPQFADLIGKFSGDKLSFFTSQDGFDKVDAFYRKLLEGEGWQLLRAESDAASKQSLLAYQKAGSKIVISIDTVPADTSSFPPEFKEFLKEGMTFILAVSGKATSAVPDATPVVIPGTPVAPLQAGQHSFATIEMEKGGKIVIELCPNLAPVTVENFEKLITKGFYNGLNFHRVEKSPKPFVVQGGDPKGDGTGGPGYLIPDEFTTQKKHLRGTVAMAHSAAANSAGSQFYICLDAAAFLDGKYAVFGQVTEGMEIVDNIAVGDKMKSITLSVK